MVDGSLLELCDERDKLNIVGAQAIDNFSLIGSAASRLVDGMNPCLLLQC